MKPLSTSPIFTLSFFTTKNHKIFQRSHYLSFYTQTQQNPSPGNHPRRQEDDRRSVPVSVWWDFENCNLPLNANVFRVGQSISNAVRANRINGPIQITAFGDVMQISRTNQEALSATGITLIHVPSGGKNSADRSLLVNLMCWVSENPPPAHLFLISGDRDFACVLHRLRLNNYNILLASPDSAPSVLCSAATIMWQWSSLLKGENLNGKLFNHPPDGPNNSLYGHYKAPLEDPFAISEQSIDETKIRPIPKAVVKHICQVLDSYPDGIAITHLRAELSNNKGNLAIDKDFYGHKKFSRFLLAMPHVLSLRAENDGQFVVRRVGNKYLDETDGESSFLEGVGEKTKLPSVVEPKVKAQSTNLVEARKEDVAEKTKLPPVLEPKVKAQSTNLVEARKEDVAEKSKLPPVQSANLVEARKEEKQNEISPSTNTQGTTKTKARATNLQDAKKEEKRKEVNTSKRKIQEVQAQLEKVVVGEIKDFSEKNENKMLVENTNGSVSEFGIIRRTWMKLFGNGDVNSSDKDSKKDDRKDSNDEKNMIFARPALFSPSSHEVLINGKNDGSGDEGVADISSHDTSFLDRVMSWFKFSSSREIGNKVEKNGEMSDILKVNDSNEDEIFSRESFWKEVESFVDTPQGSAIFSQSRTRDHLVQNLQKEGSPSLKSLSKTKLLRLVDSLISDKKWVDECNSRAFPFRLARPPALNSNGLSQIFSSVKHPNPPEPSQPKHQNPPHTGVPQHAVHRNSSSKTRSELLADCQKLTDHIVKEYPEGFNLGSFRKLFLEKNGYALDLQKLGYEKLANLLQIMPGVKIESNLIFPTGPFKDIDPKNDDSVDSSWDELGPVDDSGRGKEKRPNYDYLPVQDDDFSDSEDEASRNEANKSKLEEESSLLQILDSWYSNKGCDGKKDEPDKAESGSQPSVQMGSGTKSGGPVVGPKGKHKPGKSYTFVSEQDGDSNEKLVNGILVSLKKTGERSGDSRVLG